MKLSLHRRAIHLGMLLATLCVVLAVGVPRAGPSTALAATVAPQDTPTPLVDEAYTKWTVGGGFLYWSECRIIPALIQSNHGNKPAYSVTGYLRRMPTHGGTNRTLSTAAFCDTLLAADDSGLYSWDGASIQKRLVSAPDTAVAIYTPSHYATPYNQPPVTPLILAGNYLYWASGSEIMRLTKDGSGIAIIADSGSNPTSLAIGGDTLYWLDDGGLWQVNKNCLFQPCGETQVIAAHGGNLLYYPHRRTSLSFRSSLYWADGTNLQAYICRIDTFPTSCFVDTLYQGPAGSRIGRIGTDGNALFWTETDNSCVNGFCDDISRVLRQSFTNSTTDIIAEGIKGPHDQLWTDDVGVYFENPPISRLPFNATAIIHDLRPVAWEVTQGIQSLNNDVPLVADKPTFVRVYGKQLNGPDATTVEATLEGSRNGAPLPGSPLQPINDSHSLATGATYNRANLNDSWLFQLPDSWIGSGAIDLAAVVDGRSLYTKPNPANNRLAGTFTFTHKAPVCLVTIPVRTNAPAASNTDPSLYHMIDVVKRLMPTSDIWLYHQDSDVAQLEARFGIPPWTYEPYAIPEKGSNVLNALDLRDSFSDDPDGCDAINAITHYVGLVNANTPTNSNGGENYGLGENPGDTLYIKLVKPEVQPAQDWTVQRFGTLVHELSHNYGRNHVNCGSPASPDNGYPYNTGTIDDHPLTNPETHWGFDSNSLTPIAPTAAQDYMSYCSPFWASDYTWKALFNRISNLAADQHQVQTDGASALTAASSVVLVHGLITPTLNQGQLNYVYTFPTTALSQGILRKWQQQVAPPTSAAHLSPTGGSHTYHVRLVDGQGATLDDRTVAPAIIADDSDPAVATFMLTFPAPNGTVAHIDLLDGMTLLARLQPGTRAPAVSIAQPAGGETINDHLTVTWHATDPDANDKLLYSVQYSPDRGHTWRALATDVANLGTTDTITLDFNHLSGIPGSTSGDALIRVAASDGYHTTLATSQPFTVSNRPPQPVISTPNMDRATPAGQTTILSGAANDAEDGGLKGESLHWTVDGQSNGAGQVQHVAGLAPGAHDVALTARDAAGQAQTAHAVLNVDTLHIPLDDEPTLNGSCDDNAYATAITLQLAPYTDGTQATVHLLRTTSDVWTCFSGMRRGSGGPGSYAGVRVDVNNSRDALAQANDYGFFAGEDGTPFTMTGDGRGGFSSTGLSGLEARTSADSVSWNAELRIPAAVLGGWDHLVSIDLGQYGVAAQGDDYRWPYRASNSQPNTWARSILGKWRVFLPLTSR